MGTVLDQAVGAWVLQHHDEQFGVNFRSAMWAVRLVEQEDGRRVADPKTLGDVLCASTLSNERDDGITNAGGGRAGGGGRELPGWAFAWPSVVTSPGRFQPIKTDDYRPDRGFVETDVASPSWRPPFPVNMLSIVMAGTEHRSQELLQFPGEFNIIAPNHAPPGVMGTLVHDFDPAATLTRATPPGGRGAGWAARAQTMMRVVRPKTYLHLDQQPANVVAWNLGPTGQDSQDGWAGLGAVVGPILSPNAAVEATATTERTVESARRGADKEGAKSAPLGVAFASNLAAGPFNIGHGQKDKHQHGDTFDREQIHPLHLDLDAYWTLKDDPNVDAPAEFSRLPYQGGSDKEITVPVHWRYDALSSHPFMDQVRQGLLRWETTSTEMRSPPGDRDTPTPDPEEPDEPVPVPVPVPVPTPEQPRPRPTTPRGDAPDDEGGPAKPTGPTTGGGGGGGTGGPTTGGGGGGTVVPWNDPKTGKDVWPWEKGHPDYDPNHPDRPDKPDAPGGGIAPDDGGQGADPQPEPASPPKPSPKDEGGEDPDAEPKDDESPDHWEVDPNGFLRPPGWYERMRRRRWRDAGRAGEPPNLDDPFPTVPRVKAPTIPPGPWRDRARPGGAPGGTRVLPNGAEWDPNTGTWKGPRRRKGPTALEGGDLAASYDHSSGAPEVVYFRPTMQGKVGEIFRPQGFAEGRIEMRRAGATKAQIEADERERPAVLRMEAYGQENESGWVYTRPPGSSRHNGGEANGGLWFLLPAYDIKDADLDFNVPGAVASTGYVGLQDGVCLAFGSPDRATGGTRSGSHAMVHEGSGVKLLADGSTFTPSHDDHIATKKYVDDNTTGGGAVAGKYHVSLVDWKQDTGSLGGINEVGGLDGNSSGSRRYLKWEGAAGVSTTVTAMFESQVPVGYDRATQSITLKITGQLSATANTTNNIDAHLYQNDVSSPSDNVTTSAQAVSTTEATLSFSVDDSNLLAGDKLIIEIDYVVDDSAGATTGIYRGYEVYLEVA